MYPKIEQIIFAKKISKKELADSLSMTYNTLLLKLKGNATFTLDEAIKLKSVLNTSYSIEELFDKNACSLC